MSGEYDAHRSDDEEVWASSGIDEHLLSCLLQDEEYSDDDVFPASLAPLFGGGGVGGCRACNTPVSG